MKKVAIWGAGGIADVHAQALKYNNLMLTAIVDVNYEVVKTFAKKWKIPNYGIDKTILFAKDIDTVHVCTPPNLHYQMVKELLENGKNVICEKPLCFSSKEAEELTTLAKAKKLKCIINFNVRYHLVIDQIKKQITNPKFGKINLIHGEYLQSYHLLPTPFSWRYNPELAGEMRAITEIGTHFFDLIQYVSGQKIVALSSKFGKFNQKRKLENNMMKPLTPQIRNNNQITIDSEDAALVTFQLSDNSIGSIVLSEVTHGKLNFLKMTVTGQNGTVTWNSDHNNEFEYAYGQEDLQKHVKAFGNSFTETISALIGDFYHNKNSEKQPSIEQASYIVKVCNAVLKSDKLNGKWLKLEGNDFV